MKMPVIEIEDKVDELLAVLDKDIQHTQQSLSQLNELRSLVIKRDEAALSSLTETIQARSDDYKKHELKRQSIRKELAGLLGCGLEQMTLSKLEATLQGEKKAQVTSRKVTLRALTEELKKEHLSTVLLLSECARFNRLLLKSIFDIGKSETVTYDYNGATKRSVLGRGTTFVNLQF